MLEKIKSLNKLQRVLDEPFFYGTRIRYENEKIKVIVKQMGIGKSYLQGNEFLFKKISKTIRGYSRLSNDDIFIKL